ncbi:unnamed protein product [Rotaria magnacalcarata]|uniref:long-chain-fatty-acid--CoA ligase n=3 Tax=Rotaria magnacalcarata TaxID=392030 RepID=A0A816UW65_9BILA|nr:unnamed protein product [Rotaria magnacalcarata]
MLTRVTVFCVYKVRASLQCHYLPLSAQTFMTRTISSKGAVEIDANQHIYAHPEYSNKLFDYRTCGVTTLYEIMKYASKTYGSRPFFCYRNSSDQVFQSYTYNEIYKLTHDIGSGLAHIGLQKSNSTFVGIYGLSSIHYGIFLYSMWPFSWVPVGIYDSISLHGIQFITRHAKLQLIFTDDLHRLRNLIECHEETSPLKTLVSLQKPNDSLVQMAQIKGLRIITYDDLIRIGQAHPTEPLPPKSTDTAVIMYTSGSTGDPKGCILTHENFVCSVLGLITALHLDEAARKETLRVLTFMPLAHMFGCGTTVIFAYLGGEVGFWQGKTEKLMDDFRDFKPTLLTMVPRLLNKLYDKVMIETEKKGLIAQSIMKWAIKSKIAQIERSNFSQDTLWDKIVFNKIRHAFGNQVRIVISSSAPLSAEVAKFSRSVFSCQFAEGYGQTECIAGCWQIPSDIRSGETGVPTPISHVKLFDVPEKNYYVKDRVGEICIRGEGVFKGNLHDDIKTREAIDSEGWLHTSDIGQRTNHGAMKIIDRKNSVFKLSNGKFIAPEKIENIYIRSRFISQIYVHGNSMRDRSVALIVLDEEGVKKWLNEANNSDPVSISFETKSKLWQVVFNDMIQLGQMQHLMPHEQVKTITILKEPLTMENDLLTPTFKV